MNPWPTVHAGGPPPSVSLTLPAVASNLIVIRQVVTGAAHAAGFEEAVVNDIKVAITEACTNVVVHAYAEPGGPVDVGIWSGPEQMVIAVLDHGRGIDEGNRHQQGGLGLGMGLIAALAQSVDVAPQPDGGTLIVMTFTSSPDPDRAPDGGPAPIPA